MKFTIRLFLISILILLSNISIISKDKSIYIRTNQVGFRVNDIKTAVVLSTKPLDNEDFIVRNVKDKRTVYRNKFNDKVFSYAEFKYCYTLDFSKVKTSGKYEIVVNGTASYPFRIGDNVY